MRILSRQDVESLLDLDQLVESIAAAMVDLSTGAASMPPRGAAVVPDRQGLLATMPAYLPSVGALTTKLVSLFPQNAGTSMPTHQAVVLAFDPVTGAPLALMDGTYITAARTAAGSALATRLLARSDAAILVILGTGVQARAHARALVRDRKYTEIRLAGRNVEKARALAEELSGELGEPVRAMSGYAEALIGADVVCTTTHSPDPVVHREWLSPGVHINAVGYTVEGREIDAATVVDALVVVESRQSALAPFPALSANDITMPIRDGLITADHIHAEIGELVAGTRPGRTTPDQITLYKSVGVAVQDAAAAALVLAAAEANGIGVEVSI